MIIATHGHMYPNPPSLFSVKNTFIQAAMLLGNIVMAFNNNEERIKIAKEIIVKSYPLHFSSEFFKWLRSFKDDEGNKLPDEKINELGNVLVEKITSDISNDFSLITTNFRASLTLWNMFGERNQAKETIGEIIKSTPGLALVLMKQYLPSAWGSDGIQVESSLEKNTYDSLVSDIEVNDLIEAIHKIYPNLPEDDEYPEFINCTHEEQIVRQFLWLHRKANNQEVD